MELRLNHCDPQEVAAVATLAEIERAVYSTEEWDETVTAVLDEIYLLLTARALSADTRDAADLLTHLEQVCASERLRQNGPTADSLARWGAFADLLASRLDDPDEHPPIDEVLRYKHADRILRELVRVGGRARQQDVHQRIGLRRENAYRIVTKMVEYGAVRKVTRGLENELLVTDAGRTLGQSLLQKQLVQEQLAENLRLKVQDLRTAMMEEEREPVLSVTPPLRDHLQRVVEHARQFWPQPEPQLFEALHQLIAHPSRAAVETAVRLLA